MIRTVDATPRPWGQGQGGGPGIASTVRPLAKPQTHIAFPALPLAGTDHRFASGAMCKNYFLLVPGRADLRLGGALRLPKERQSFALPVQRELSVDASLHSAHRSDVLRLPGLALSLLHRAGAGWFAVLLRWDEA